MPIFTVDKHGRPGMPTFNVKKIRKLLKSGKAEVFCYRPFTVKLLYADSLNTQPVELCIDAGDRGQAHRHFRQVGEARVRTRTVRSAA